MKLSAPVYRLKRKARLLSRREKVPLHLALDRIAAEEGYASWSLLAARLSAVAPAARLLARLSPGDLVLVGARPGHGKTLLSLELALEAMKAGRRSAFFSLEYAPRDIDEQFRAIGADFAHFRSLFAFDTSDAISADYIVRALQGAPRGMLVVIDYLQALDHRRENPALEAQIQTLKAFAAHTGVIFVIISQIDRAYDAARKPCPDLADVRLSNPLDLSLFSKACFLNNGDVRFTAVAARA